MFKFSLKVMSKEKSKNMSFILTMLILTTVECMFFELTNHSIVLSMPNADRKAFNLLSLLIITFSFFITFYVNSQHLDYKRKELGLLYLSGRNLMDISKYLMAQYFIIFIISIPIGMLLASLILPVFYYLINQYYRLNIDLFQYNAIGYIETIVLVITKIIYIIIINSAFTYRNEIIEIINGTYKKKNKDFKNVALYGGGTAIKTSYVSLGTIGMSSEERSKILNQTIKEGINEKQKKRENKKNKGRIPTILSILFYIYSILAIIINKSKPENYMLYVYINIISVVGVISCAIPYLIGKAHHRFINKSPVRFVVYNDLLLLLNNILVPVILIVVFIPYIISILNIKMSLDIYRAVACFGYIVLTIILAGSLYFRNMFYINSRENEFKVLDAIGYHQSIIKAIINREVIYSYIIATILPIIIIVIEMLQMVSLKIISTSIAFLILGSYFIIFFISFLLTLYSFGSVKNFV